MTFSKPKRKNNDDSLPVWAWIFIGMVVMAAAAIVIYFGMLVIAFDGFMEETYFRLSDDSARSYAYHELKIDIPSDASGIFLEYNVDYSSPVTLRFDVPVSLGTDWVDEVICPQDRFPNAEVSMRNPLEAISSIPPDEQPIQWVVSCSANPNMQIYMQQDEPETWHITITAPALIAISLMQKSKRKQKFRVRTLAETGFIVLAILGVGLFFFIVCVWVVVNLLGGHQQIELQGFEAQTRAEEILGLVLPDDASSFYFDYSRFVDWNTHIRFEIPPTNDTASLIEGICSEQAVRDVSREDLLPEDDLQWWHPDAAVDYLAASCPVSQMAFFSYFILIDQSNSEAWTVYITADSSRD